MLNFPNDKFINFHPQITQILLSIVKFLLNIGDYIRHGLKFIFILIQITYNKINYFRLQIPHFHLQIPPYPRLPYQPQSFSPRQLTTFLSTIKSKTITYFNRIISFIPKKQPWNVYRETDISPGQTTWIPQTSIFFPPSFARRLVLRSLGDRRAATSSLVKFSQSLLRLRSFIFGVLFTIIIFFIPFVAYEWLLSLPNPQLLSKRNLEVTSKIYDRNGNLLYEMYADENRTPLALTDIPLVVRQATIAIEDKDFYNHPGISISGIIRALSEMLLHGRLQGGSTLTQQLIKSSLLTPEVKLSRKIKEIVLAFWAEKLYTKDQILEMYLNQVPYGGTSWGIETAARTYFGKSIKNVSLAEAALLAGLPAAPTEYSPFGSQPDKAYFRQREVLRRMVEDRYITQKEAEDALKQILIFAAPRTAIRAPHFVMYVKNILEKKYGPRLVERGGLRIVTSLDLGLQEKVADIVTSQLKNLKSLNVSNAAVILTNPKTGEILTMVGSRDYFDLPAQGNVNVTTALRQPGSSIKVVTYTYALESGLYTPASLIEDAPVIYRTPGSAVYAPVNYDGRFHGWVPLRYALGNSYNIPAVKILDKIQVQNMISMGTRMGIESWADSSRFGLSLTLGAGEVTLLDLARVYGTLANSGKLTQLNPILEVTTYTGQILEHAQINSSLVIKPEVAWIMSNILSDNAARTSAFGPNSTLVIPGKTVSVKTGTSNDKRDNLTIGYTPSLLAAVWVGNNDNSPMHPLLTSGITGAAPIWHQVMETLLINKPDEVTPRPPTITSLPCYFGRIEYFLPGTEPKNGSCTPIPTSQTTPTIIPKP